MITRQLEAIIREAKRKHYAMKAGENKCKE